VFWDNRALSTTVLGIRSNDVNCIEYLSKADVPVQRRRSPKRCPAQGKMAPYGAFQLAKGRRSTNVLSRLEGKNVLLIAGHSNIGQHVTHCSPEAGANIVIARGTPSASMIFGVATGAQIQERRVIVEEIDATSRSR